MKKWVCLVLALTLLVGCGVAGAEAAKTDLSALSDEELRVLVEEKDAKIAELEARISELEEMIGSNPPVQEPVYETLQIGSNGNAVKTLQERLKVLNYLEGSADGAFGKGTAGAVSAFQAEVGLEATGIADDATQAALFSDDAPKAKVYVNLDYKAVSRDPDSYKGTMIKFTGKILQVIECDDYINFRITSRGNYDDVVYCTYKRPENYKRFLEDDKVEVWATSTGIYSYTTVMGSEVTIPSCIVDRIELK